MFCDDKMFYSPAVMLENVIDPTGAGDSFAGGFVGHLEKTQDFSFENMKRLKASYVRVLHVFGIHY